MEFGMPTLIEAAELDACEEAIGDSDVKICIENCDGFKGFQQEGIELLLASKLPRGA